jgi:dienelactone hydrolase
MRIVLIAAIFMVLSVMSYAQVTVSGTVKDTRGNLLEEALVTLGSDPSVTDLTNADGKFSITTATPVNRDVIDRTTPPYLRSLELRRNQLYFSIISSVTQGSISIQALDGSEKYMVTFNYLEAGVHHYPLPKMASGIYIMHVSIGSFTKSMKCMAVTDGGLLGGNVSFSNSSRLLKRQAEAVDSIIVTKEGFLSVTHLIENTEETDIEITMRPESPLPPVTDYSAFGPYSTVTETNTGPDGSYTIIRPETLGEDGFLHAPITFGPGTGMQVSQMSDLIKRIASHGFVVIGRKLEGGPGDPVTRQRLIAGLDWIIEQNSVSGSDYEGKIAVDRGVSMGYSVGATGSIEIGGHEALATVVAIHGHSAEGELHTPVLMIGGTSDLMGSGESWLAPSYEASQVQTFFGMVTGADHGYIQRSVEGVQGGVETPAIIAWIRYWIYNDEGAKHYFYGDDCVMCTSPWTNPQRKFWE